MNNQTGQMQAILFRRYSLQMPGSSALFSVQHLRDGENMELLFKREQTAGKLSRVTFKLWGKLELDADEQALVKRYRFDQAILLEELQPTLIRNAGILGIIAGGIAYLILDLILPNSFALLLGLAAAAGVAYWHYNEKRETIFVRDLLHGRHFTCHTVLELAHKEAWLEAITSFLRQVMESAKHWDGTEKITIEVLPKNEARQFILKGI